MSLSRRTESAGRRARRRIPPRGLLAVDVGNSETVVGVFRGKEPVHFWRLTSGRATADEVSLQLEALLRRDGGIEGRGMGAVLCSVAPSLTLQWLRALETLTGKPPVEVTAATARGLPIRYHDPGSVGADRIANAVAARAIYGTPAIVVDLGTATTFDCVSKQGAYVGGVIVAGVLTAAEELFRRAARIPRVELRRPARALGRTTEEALQAGMIWGTAGQVDALVRRLALEMKGTPHVIATGGLARLIAPECETINRVDEALTLKGMRLIWEEQS
ncbi:MAG TPA: type III pantothenate kinase [Candidatus Sulfotelmatobacter sp.]|nr:type III pantothenate kinase [Candidatus Sulfotelmatobacter sp.]